MTRKIFILSLLLLMALQTEARKRLVVALVETCGKSSASVGRNYVDALVEGGNSAFILPCTKDTAMIDQLLKKTDIVYLCGGEDVAPAYYHTEASPKLGDVNDMRDSFEWLVLSRARRHRIPIVGVCRGIQMLNVFFGGTLYQDLPSENPSEVTHSHSDMPDKPTHYIQIEPDSRLMSVLHEERIGVNSTHHQAVKQLAPGFRISAKADDGVVEAIEGLEYPAFGMQFHPERLVGKDARFKAIYKSLKKLVK